MRQPLGRHQTYSSSAVTGRERKIIPIIDPTTGEEIITGSEHQRLNSTGDSAIEISADLSSSDLSTSAVSKSNVDENNSAAHQAALDQHKSEVLMEFHRKIAGVALEKTSPTSGKQPTPSNQPTTVEAVAEVETVPLQVNGGLSAPEERAVSAKSRVVGVAVKILRRDMELTKPPPTLEVEIPVELAIVAEDNKQYSGESKSPDAQQSETGRLPNYSDVMAVVGRRVRLSLINSSSQPIRRVSYWWWRFFSS